MQPHLLIRVMSARMCSIRGHTVTTCRVDKNVVCHQRHKKCHSKGKRKLKSSGGKSGIVCQIKEGEEPESEDTLLFMSNRVMWLIIHVKVKLDECLVRYHCV